MAPSLIANGPWLDSDAAHAIGPVECVYGPAGEAVAGAGLVVDLAVAVLLPMCLLPPVAVCVVPGVVAFLAVVFVLDTLAPPPGQGRARPGRGARPGALDS